MANTNDPSLPNARAALVDARGLPASEWRKFFEKLSRQPTLTADQSAEIAALAGRVAALEAEGVDLGQIIGLGSVSAVGSLGDQVVIQLQGDEDAPTASYYYGTDDTGVRGWHPLALESLSDIDLITTPPVAGDALLFDGVDTWAPGAVLANPMTTLGDIIVADVGGVPDRLGVGADGDVLTIVGGVPAYAAPTTGGHTRGITVTGGSISGSVISVAETVGGLSASDYTLTGNWYLWCSPSGSIELDVRRAPFGSLPPGPGDSICGGNEPAVSAALSASGIFTGWSTSIARNDALSVVVNSVTDVTWFVLLLEAV